MIYKGGCKTLNLVENNYCNFSQYLEKVLLKSEILVFLSINGARMDVVLLSMIYINLQQISKVLPNFTRIYSAVVPR